MAQMLPRKKYCPTAILAEKRLNQTYGPLLSWQKIYWNKKYYLTAVLAQLYLKHIGQKCGPSAMLAKGKDRDEGCDHAKKTKCELNVLHCWLLGIICSISKSARLRLRVCVLIHIYSVTHPFLHHGMRYIMYLWHTQLNVKDSWPKDWLILFHNIMQGILPAQCTI